MEFRWNEWNLEHATCHGVSPEEAEYVVDWARPPYPEEVGDEKYRVRGKAANGRYIRWSISSIPMMSYTLSTRGI